MHGGTLLHPAAARQQCGDVPSALCHGQVTAAQHCPCLMAVLYIYPTASDFFFFYSHYYLFFKESLGREEAMLSLK